MQTISNNIFVQHNQCGQRRRGEKLGRGSWSVNAYYTRAASFCEDKHGHLQNAEGSCLAGSWIADGVFISHAVLRLFDAFPDCI